MCINRLLIATGALLASGMTMAANVAPDGDYNFTDVDQLVGFNIFTGVHAGLIGVAPQIVTTDAYVLGFNSVDSSIHFNDGLGGGNVSYYGESSLEFFQSSQNSLDTGYIWHFLEAGSSSDWEQTGQYTANNNMLSAVITDTEEPGAANEEVNIFNQQYMSTPNGALIFGFSKDIANQEPDICVGCDEGSDMYMNNWDHEYSFHTGLKKGNSPLLLVDMVGSYLIDSTESHDNGCLELDLDGNPNDLRELCETGVHGTWSDIELVVFNGNGTCSVPQYVVNDLATVHPQDNYFNISVYAEGPLVKGPAASCSYTVSGVDNLVLTMDHDGDPDTYKLKVSSDKRHLQGDDQFSTNLPSIPVNEWRYRRGVLWGLKVQATPALGSLSGTYLGSFRATEFNDCTDFGACPNDWESERISNGNIALTFDGSGGCSMKESISSTSLNLLKNQYDGLYLGYDKENLAATSCSYALDQTIANLPAIKVILSGASSETLTAFISDDGNTLLFKETVFIGAIANPRTVPELDYFSSIVQTAYMGRGIAIKYDGTVTDAVINKWLDEVAVKDDFGGDNKADILTRHSTTGQLYLHEMNGNIRTGSNIGALSTAWAVAGIGDFGGDGKADILLRRSSTGQLYLLEMDGSIRTGSSIGGLSTVWAVAGVGDFGGDGKADILLRHTVTGQLYLLEMDGNQKTGSNIGGLSLGWDVVGVGDLGVDGKADIVIRNSTTGQLYLNEMDGNIRTGSKIGGLSLGWNVVGIGDLGGDGKDDIVIRNSATGQLYLNEMDGNIRTGSSIGGLSRAWKVARIADYGGDGKADLLIRKTSTGQLFLNEMDGNVKTGSNVGGLPTVWKVEVQ